MFEFREDGFVSATKILQMADKKPFDYFRAEENVSHLRQLAQILGVPEDCLIERGKGGGQHTWVHYAIACRMARWVSQEAEIKSDLWLMRQLNECKQEADFAKQEIALVKTRFALAAAAIDASALQGEILKFKSTLTIAAGRLNDMTASNNAIDLMGLLSDGANPEMVSLAFQLLKRTHEAGKGIRTGTEKCDVWDGYDKQIENLWAQYNPTPSLVESF